MPSSVQTLTLTAHAETPSEAVRRLRVTLSRSTASALALTYIAEGQLDKLRIPGQREARVADNLWQHTCFEAFITAPNWPGYYELNFSPSGEWAVYEFARYRERTTPGIDAERLRPRIAARTSPERLELDTLIPLDRLPCVGAAGKLAMAISAVLEEKTGRLTFWALRHPSGKPDFHHPDAFALELDEIRN